MFVLKDIEEFDWAVTVRCPVDDNRFETRQIKARFRVADQATTDALESGEANDRDFLRRVLVGWGGVGDEDGNALPFRDDYRDQMLGFPWVRSALLDAYFEAVSGGRLKAKN